MKLLNYDIDVNELSPQLQVLINLELRQNALEKKVQEKPVQMKMSFSEDMFTEAPLQIPPTFISPSDWRRDTNSVICAIERKRKNYSALRGKIYRELEARGKCNLEKRLENLRKNMVYQGQSKSAAAKMNYLDVIEKDERLIHLFVSIVREIARVNGVSYSKTYSKEVIS